MAEFEPAFQRVARNEGGFVVSHLKNDSGGQTFCGISRNNWGKWDGWKYIDAGDTPPTDLVRKFYRETFWSPLKCDEVKQQRIAENIFDFGINAGTATAIRLAQAVIGSTPDGKVGPKTIAALNAIDEHTFLALYALAKLTRYRDICTKNPSQKAFLLGWVNRLLKEAA